MVAFPVKALRRGENIMPLTTIDTPYGAVDVDPNELELGELVVSDDGSELEVVGLDPLRFEPAPEEDEDWGE
jgi:lysine biosynthesis protein LysW